MDDQQKDQVMQDRATSRVDLVTRVDDRDDNNDAFGLLAVLSSQDILKAVDEIGPSRATPNTIFDVDGAMLNDKLEGKPAGTKWTAAMQFSIDRDETKKSREGTLETVLIGLAERGIDFRERDEEGISARQFLRSNMEAEEGKSPKHIQEVDEVMAKVEVASRNATVKNRAAEIAARTSPKVKASARKDRGQEER